MLRKILSGHSYAAVIFVVISIVFACRRNEGTSTGSSREAEQFLTAPADASEELKGVIADLRKQNNAGHFLPALIRNYGLPVWGKTVSNVPVVKNGVVSSSGKDAAVDSSLFFIPMQSAAGSVNAYVICLNVKDKYHFKLMGKEALQNADTSLPYRKSFLRSSLSIFALFEKEINGKDSLFIGGLYNKHFSGTAISFKNTTKTGSRGSLYMTGVEICFRITCVTEQQSLRGSVSSDGCWNCVTYWYYNVGGGGGSGVVGNVDTYWYEDGSGGGGGSGGSSLFDIDPATIANALGVKPLFEYPDSLRSQGFKDMWYNYPDNEVMAYITADGKLIVTDIVPQNGGFVYKTFSYTDPLTNIKTDYYVYPVSEGAPSLNYDGMKTNGLYYYIPVVASVHTHTPCLTDGTNGVSHGVSSADFQTANINPSLRNWVIGCEAIARFDNTNSNYFNIQTGLLSNLCTLIY